MSRATLLEVRGKIARLIAGTDAGFRFFPSLPAFDVLDGRRVPSIIAVQRAADALTGRRVRKSRPLGRVAWPFPIRSST